MWLAEEDTGERNAYVGRRTHVGRLMLVVCGRRRAGGQLSCADERFQLPRILLAPPAACALQHRPGLEFAPPTRCILVDGVKIRGGRHVGILRGIPPPSFRSSTDVFVLSYDILLPVGDLYAHPPSKSPKRTSNPTYTVVSRRHRAVSSTPPLPQPRTVLSR
ncbi:unnamed protein product [Cyclocybe aegerita]|uniref:Uncharacterized protein n=1 Tax=Cyclocybe aegerita TaxID=1973307 RepID=A0A8S0X8P0_CYCAE|nr:unnamed protein product [Cyclocybe aegerita]